MPVGQAVAPHLPFLRRYARALTGSQPAGDRIVVRMLEQLAADPAPVEKAGNLRLALYRLVQAQCDATGAGDAAPDETATGDIAIADARLRPIPLRARQALLLTAVEGFSDADAGTILGLSGDAVAALVDDAVEAIDAQTRARVLIIEDEPIIALDIELIVEGLGHEVVGVASTHREAVALATEQHPSLVLADIQLADNSSGIEAVQEILSAVTLPVIFITAFPERLLTGARPEPTFLLTKPYQPATLRAALAQALFFDKATIPA